MAKKELDIRDVISSILERTKSYGYALGATEAMLEAALRRFATPEQMQEWIQEQAVREERMCKPF